MPQQHPEDLSVRMICRVEQAFPLKIPQNEITDIEVEPLVHRCKAALFEIVQPYIVDDAVDRQRAVGAKTLLPVGDLFAQLGEQPVEVKKSRVRGFALISFAIAGPVIMIERPQRSKVQQREFDNRQIVMNIGAKWVILPIFYILNEHYVAAREVLPAELMQIVL